MNLPERTKVPARTDVIMVDECCRVAWRPLLVERGERSLILLAIDAYMFCLDIRQKPRPATYSLQDFAQAVKKVYCEEEPHNAAIIKALEDIHQRLALAASQGQLI